MSLPAVSLIIPVLNESDIIVDQLNALQPLREQGIEIIVVDGGSNDQTPVLAKPLVDGLIESEKGRAIQMNAGAAKASGSMLVFLHIDTELPSDVLAGFKHWNHRQIWGFFPLRLSGKKIVLRIIEKAINVRSKVSGIGTGDQVLFCHQALFQQVGGYSTIPLMEDIAFCKQLKKIMPPLVEVQSVVTSSRRWEQKGIIHTILLMWWLRLAYFLGVSPEKLVTRYYSS